jgi:hypothetical protein
LQDELLDGNKIDKWNGNGITRLFTPAGNSCNGTKATPNLSADILGDWREEVILHDGNSKLYLYTTTIPTTNRLYTLMHDAGYRAGVASEQSSYNQPPHLGFFLGNGADKAPKPNMYVTSPLTGVKKTIAPASKINPRQYTKCVFGAQSFSINSTTKGTTDLQIFDLTGNHVKNITIANGTVKLKDLGISGGAYIVKTNIINRIR